MWMYVTRPKYGDRQRVKKYVGMMIEWHGWSVALGLEKHTREAAAVLAVPWFAAAAAGTC